MKKLGIFCAALLALGFASCDDTSDLGIMQTNPQEAVMAAGGVTVDYGEALKDKNAINLADYEGKTIPVITLVEAKDLPEGAEVNFEMQISGTEDFAKSVTVPVVDGAVACADWDNAFRSLLGKAPFAKDNYVRFVSYIAKGSQLSRVGTPETYFAAKKISVTPIDLHIKIEDAYYLVGSINGWDLSTAVPFNHSDLSPYDDPVFTLAVDIPAAEAGANQEFWWKIVPASSFEAQSWDGLFGTLTDGDDALEGNLVENGNAGCLKVAGQYLFTLDMLNCSYTVTQAIPMLYTPGGGNGWGFDSGWLSTNDYANYQGFVHLNGEFKITDRPAWGGIEWGKGDTEGTMAVGAGNIAGPADGLYLMNVNISSLTYNYTLIESLGMIGDFNDWSAQQAMTSEDFLVWKGTLTITAPNQGFKFRMNDNWDINLGGDLANLSLGGDNISVAPGTYEVTLDLTTIPYTCTIAAK